MTPPIIRTRPGAPPRRDPAPFTTPDRPGTCDVIDAVCGGCREIQGSKEFGQHVHRCGIAVRVARELNRRLPGTISPTRLACSRYDPKGSRR